MNTTKPSKSKIIKCQFNRHHTAYIKIEKNVCIISGDNFNFVQCSSKGVNIQAAPGAPIALQTMGTAGPMHMKMMWPLTLLAGPLAMPKDIPYPPYMDILADLPPLFDVAKGLALS